ncbi:unnamed protein product [Mytilus coruscus]|uniref:Immunoglobulin subtype domain-containing protein n=1 Tax=Mytilus coruscus TaxID=42192 RepID=A0A6J8DK58_MYTCO|nr:unnamed protein product [Mytilus coruscus]
MKTILRIFRILLCVISFVSSGSSMCNTNICLDWKMDVNKLTLTCRIKHLHLRVFMYDPHGTTQAVCLPPYPFVCEAYYKYGSMSYSSISKEIQFTVNRETSKKMEGYWTCRHGTGRDISKVFVSMKITTGSQSTADSHTKIYSTDRKTTKPSTAAQTLSHRTSKIIEFKYYSGIIFSKFYGLFIGAALLLFVMFIVCNIWISRRCRDIPLKKEDAGEPNHSNETAEHAIAPNEIETDEEVDRISDYESINENEILPFPSGIAFGGKDSSLDTETFSTNHSCKHENNSSSDNSYLEVIDDDTYLNPYQSIEIHHDSELVHDYCTTSSFNFLEMCSPKLTEKPQNEHYSTCDTNVSIGHDKLDITVQSESPEINASFSEKSPIVHDILIEQTSFAIKPDNNDSKDGGIFPSHAMSTLL